MPIHLLAMPKTCVPGVSWPNHPEARSVKCPVLTQRAHWKAAYVGIGPMSSNTNASRVICRADRQTGNISRRHMQAMFEEDCGFHGPR